MYLKKMPFFNANLSEKYQINIATQPFLRQEVVIN